MKKTVTFIFLTLLCVSANSQDLYLGASAGANYSTILSKNEPSQKGKIINYENYKIGYQANAILGYNRNVKLGVQIEPGFINRGGSQYIMNSQVVSNINYFNLPILVKVAALDYFFIHLGPEFGFRTSATTTHQSETNDAKSFYDSKFDVGLNGGFTYRIYEKIDLSFRLYRGFVSTSSSTYKDENGQDMGKSRLYNYGASISLGYVIK